MFRSNSNRFLMGVLLAVILLAIIRHFRQATPPSRAPRERSRQTQPDRSYHDRDYSRSYGARERGREGQDRRDPECRSADIACSSSYFTGWQEPAAGSCTVSLRAGNDFPDPRCTPGGIDPAVTEEVLRDREWRTRCARNCETSEAEKHITYRWYAIHKPQGNSGPNQVCELDHLVPLELGGADGLGNIWPECGPAGAELPERDFKVKDRVENYLADQVRSGRMPLQTAQHGIAEDWAQFLDAANAYCRAGGRC